MELFSRRSVSLGVEPGGIARKTERIEGKGYYSTLLAGNHLVTRVSLRGRR